VLLQASVEATLALTCTTTIVGAYDGRPEAGCLWTECSHFGAITRLYHMRTVVNRLVVVFTAIGLAFRGLAPSTAVGGIASRDA